MPITATALLRFWDMACSSPCQIRRWRGRSTAGTIPLADLAGLNGPHEHRRIASAGKRTLSFRPELRQTTVSEKSGITLLAGLVQRAYAGPDAAIPRLG